MLYKLALKGLILLNLISSLHTRTFILIPVHNHYNKILSNKIFSFYSVHLRLSKTVL
jgi:hypothetical protein